MKWKCGNCGAEFDEGTKFCPNCGTKINGKTPQTDQTFTCGNCGGEFKGRVGYCPHCGSPIIWDDDNNERLTSTQKIFLIISTIVAIVNVLLYINNFFSNIFFGLFVLVSPVLPFFTWVNLDKIQTEYNISSKLAINGLFSVIIATFIFLSSRAIYEMVRLTDSTQGSEQILVEKESEAERKESEKKKEAPKKEINPYVNFIGEYTIYSDGGVTNDRPFTVVDDGRFFEDNWRGDESIKRMTKVGKIHPISDKAFELFLGEDLITDNVFSYVGNNQSTRYGYGVKSGRIILFDLSEGKIYIDMDDYNNRDYASPEYFKFRFTKK